MEAGKLLSKEQLDNINSAITNCEKNTNGELAVVLVHHSDLYPASHYRLALCFTLFSYALLCYFLPDFIKQENVYLYTAPVILYFIGHLLSWNKKLRYFFVTRKEVNEEVKQRSMEAFLQHNLHHTNERNGVLIFISYWERKIELLADKGINEKVDQTNWLSIVGKLSAHMKDKDLENGIINSIEDCSVLMAKYFPKTEDDENELADQIIVED